MIDKNIVDKNFHISSDYERNIDWILEKINNKETNNSLLYYDFKTIVYYFNAIDLYSSYTDIQWLMDEKIANIFLIAFIDNSRFRLESEIQHLNDYSENLPKALKDLVTVYKLYNGDIDDVKKYYNSSERLIIGN